VIRLMSVPEKVVHPHISKLSFGAASVGIVSFGVLLGIRHQLRVEKFNFRSVTGHTPFVIASKAFLYGTLLCFASFGGTMSVFSCVTGIRSLQQFSDTLKSKLSKNKQMDDMHVDGDEEYKNWSDVFASESSSFLYASSKAKLK
jgi:hypothetical protein